MHIAIDLTSLTGNYSGIEQYAANIAMALSKRGESCTLTLLFQNEVFPSLVSTTELSHVTTRILLPKHKSKLAVSQLDVAKEMRSIRADAYFFPAFPQPLTFHSKHAFSVIHDVSFFDCPKTLTTKSVMYWRAVARHAAKARLLFTVSEFSKRRIAATLGIPMEAIRVAHNGISSAFLDAQTNPHQGAAEKLSKRYGIPERYILSLCTLEPRKNLPFLVDAWTRAFELNPCIPDLVLAGRQGWKIDELLSHIPEKVRSHIHLTGFVESEDLPLIYHQSERFVYPSVYEGFGLPPLEALAAGASVLCSDIEVFHETCDGFGGLVGFFPLGDTTKLIELLLSPAHHPNAAQSTAVCRRFNWHDSAKVIIDSLAEVL